jgi:phage-related tail fiber protein
MPLPAYYALLTTVGLQRLAQAQMSGVPLVFTHMAAGDGGGSPIAPSAAMAGLVNERARVSINAVTIADDGPTTVKVEGFFPAATGGFTIREFGLFNGAGELIAIASCPPTYKPVPADGVTSAGYVRINLRYENPSAIAPTVDGSVIVATREDLDNATAGGLLLWERFT